MKESEQALQVSRHLLRRAFHSSSEAKARGASVSSTVTYEVNDALLPSDVWAHTSSEPPKVRNSKSHHSRPVAQSLSARFPQSSSPRTRPSIDLTYKSSRRVRSESEEPVRTTRQLMRDSSKLTSRRTSNGGLHLLRRAHQVSERIGASLSPQQLTSKGSHPNLHQLSSKGSQQNLKIDTRSAKDTKFHIRKHSRELINRFRRNATQVRGRSPTQSSIRNEQVLQNHNKHRRAVSYDSQPRQLSPLGNHNVVHSVPPSKQVIPDNILASWSKQQNIGLVTLPDLRDEQQCDAANVADFPTKVWQAMQQVPISVPYSPPSSPLDPSFVRFVCISDTHGKHYKINNVPDGDVLLCAGDISMTGEVESLFSFSNWLRRLPHKHKIVISGNHDITLQDDGFYETNFKRFHSRMENAAKAREIMRSATHFNYLEDASVEVEGYKVYGSPWQPTFLNWGFNLPRGKCCREKWKAIPTDTDILLVHGPPLGYGDSLENGEHVGCLDLLREIQLRIRPLATVYGHVHESYGVYTDGVTKYVNASTCDHSYAPINPPIVFDLPSK